MIELYWLDFIGWIGLAGLSIFYWLLGSGKVLMAYIYGIIGAMAWLIVGIATKMGYASELPSLIVMEAMVIVMNIRGIYYWKKEQNNKDKLSEE